MISDEGVVVSGKVGQKKSRIAYPGGNEPNPDPNLFKIRIRTFSKAASGSELSQKLDLDPCFFKNRIQSELFKKKTWVHNPG